MTSSSFDKLRRAMLSCLSRPADSAAGYMEKFERVMVQKAPRSVSWRFTPKSCEACEGVCRVGVSCRRSRHGPIMFSRWVPFAWRLALWMSRFFQRSPIPCGELGIGNHVISVVGWGKDASQGRARRRDSGLRSTWRLTTVRCLAGDSVKW